MISYLCIPVPYNETDIFFWVLVLEGLVGLHKTVQLQLLHHYCQGIDLDYRDIEWFALETNRHHSVVFEIVSKYCISDSSVDYDGYSMPSKGFFHTAVDLGSSSFTVLSFRLFTLFMSYHTVHTISALWKSTKGKQQSERA